MQYTPSHKVSDITPSLSNLLQALRVESAFNPADYVRQKTAVINAYFRTYGLKAAVVAVSGGIDSALVLALIHAASKADNSPIERIVPVLMPVFDSEAATNQVKATCKGTELCKQLGLSPVLLDITQAHYTTRTLVDAAVGIQGKSWASGQLVATQRTPALYYITSLLSQEKLPAVLVGTTNYDEGAYLGYFGKASDGLVDLQLISDLHKSEVYQAAAYLKVPSSIMTAVPTGDMYDGRVDEEVFGASYDFVELFLHIKRNLQLKDRITALDVESQSVFTTLWNNLEALHNYNGHKYFAHSPAVHFDILDRTFPGSWQYFVWKEA